MTKTNPDQSVDSSSTALDVVAAEIPLDVERIRAQCAAVLGEQLYWFPVRHHSPAVARFVEMAIASRKPKVVFIEAPSETQHLVKHVTDPKTKPPIAIYSSFRDDNNLLGLAGIFSAAEHIPPRFSCWYPMLPYSPEYVAMRAAKKHNCEVVFIDLPHFARLKPQIEGDLDPLSLLFPPGSKPGTQSKPAADHTSGSDDTGDSDDTSDSDHTSSSDDAKPDSDTGANASPAQSTGNGGAAPPETPKLESSEQLIAESAFMVKLAEVAGYRSWNEAWDSLFEMRDFGGDIELFRAELATFCAAARATSSPLRIATDGTLERERYMLRTIRQTLSDKKLQDSDAMIVCGGFHLFLDRDDQTQPPELPEGTVYSTIVPYSYFRVSELSGYGAGNRAPQFYQTVWDFIQEGCLGDVLIEHVIAVLKQARKSGEPLSSADAIAVCQHAEMLARLRGRPMPVLDDINDALITCCCKGDPGDVGGNLLKAMDAAGIGTKLGRVTPDLGQLPLLSDFYAELSLLDLGELIASERMLKLELDKRDDLGNKRSIFFHRLKFLGVPIGVQSEAPSGDFDTGKIFREKWALKWNPDIESKLIELTLYGDTIEVASLSKLREALALSEMQAGATCRRLVSAIDMDLPNMVREAEDAVSKAIDNDTKFVSQADALSCLLLIDRYAVYRNLRRGLLDDLIIRSFDRACFSLIDVIAAPEDQQMSIVNALLSLAEVMVRGDAKGLDRTLFIEHVTEAAAATEILFLRGALLGVLTELRVLTADDLAAELSLMSRAPVEIMVKAGDFLDGVMAVSRSSLLLGADSLVAAIDELLKAADWQTFLTMLPRMRAAFERLHDRQRDAFAARVAQRYGLTEKESLTELRTSAAAATHIARIDQMVALIMKEWNF